MDRGGSRQVKLYRHTLSAAESALFAKVTSRVVDGYLVSKSTLRHTYGYRKLHYTNSAAALAQFSKLSLIKLGVSGCFFSPVDMESSCKQSIAVLPPCPDGLPLV